MKRLIVIGLFLLMLCESIPEVNAAGTTLLTEQEAQCRDLELLLKFKYVGELNEAWEKHGKGKVKDNDGYSYAGEWKFDKIWNGVRCSPDGTISGVYIDGIWHPRPEPCKHEDYYTIDGKRVKECEFYSGDRYVGETKHSEYHGQGTYTWADGSKYVGEYKDGKEHGQGTLNYHSIALDPTRKYKYSGQWENGLRHGQGTETDGEGKYVGEWQVGFRHGQGTFTWVSGTKYVGEWKDNKPHGQGTKTWSLIGPDDKYVGEWKDGKRHGQGTMTEGVQFDCKGPSTWVSGIKYVGGGCKDNKSLGEIFKGEFKKGSKWNGTKYNPEGTVIGTYSDGEWIPK